MLRKQRLPRRRELDSVRTGRELNPKKQQRLTQSKTELESAGPEQELKMVMIPRCKSPHLQHVSVVYDGSIMIIDLDYKVKCVAQRVTH